MCYSETEPCLNGPEWSKKHFGIESKHLVRITFNEVNKLIEDNHRYFYPPENPDDYRFDVGNEHELVEDVDPQSLIKIVKHQAPTPYTTRGP